jgi:hypothetical protein
MSEATDKLARSRLAIVDHIHRRERRHDPRETPAPGYGLGGDAEPPPDPPDPGSGWLGHMKHAVKTWWRYHPAHMAVDIASPMLQAYAQRKPMHLLAISAGAGAVLMFARPWKIISLTTIAVAVLKSSQLSGLLMAAMSAADYRKDNDRPG